MDLPKFQLLYNQLTDSSSSDAVDTFWNALLNRHIPQDEFIITRYARPTKSDFNIQNVTGAAETQHVILIAAKSAEWDTVINQLTNDMLQTRDQDRVKLGLAQGTPLTYSMYGIMAVGSQSRFYVLPPTGNELEDLPGTADRLAPLRVREDAQDIMSCFEYLVREITPYGLLSSSALSAASSD